MKLPSPDRAVIDLRKLRDYCLNHVHHRGQHKARLFKSALGLTAQDALELQELLLSLQKMRMPCLLERMTMGNDMR